MDPDEALAIVLQAAGEYATQVDDDYADRIRLAVDSLQPHG